MILVKGRRAQDRILDGRVERERELLGERVKCWCNAQGLS